MNLLRLIQTAGILGLVATGLSSCLTEPSYSTTPSIAFNNIKHDRYIISNSPVDSVLITIDFQDGDGDLGVTAAEEASAANTKFRGRNYIMTPFVKNSLTGRFDSLKTVRPVFVTKTAYYDRFDHISNTTDNRAAPLRGTLTRRYSFTLNEEFVSNQEIRFRVSILDRALHQSNEIETSSIIIK